MLDEASRVSDSLYGAVCPMLAVSRGRIMASSTAYGQRGWFYKEYVDPKRTDLALLFTERGTVTAYISFLVGPIQEKGNSHGRLKKLYWSEALESTKIFLEEVAMSPEIEKELEAAVKSDLPLAEIVTLLRRYKKQGIAQADVYSFLERLHHPAPDQASGDRFLEFADFVAGSCAPHMKIWDDEIAEQARR